jgi:hypothetical protein
VPSPTETIKGCPLDEDGYADFTRAMVTDDIVAFPAYGCVYVIGHLRDLVGWVHFCNLIAHDPDPNKERVFRRREVAKVFMDLLQVTEQGAYGILRRGLGHFWDYEEGEAFLEIKEPREIHSSIHANELLAWIPTELIAVPKSAFTNLFQLRAHMSLRAQSKDLDGETCTPMAYTAKLARVQIGTARGYRHYLRRVRYLATQKTYCFYIKDPATDPHRAEFPARRNPKETARRLADTVILDRAKIISGDPLPKAIQGAEGLYREDILTYIFSDRNGIATRPPEAVSQSRGARRRKRKRPVDFTRYRFKPNCTRLMSWYPASRSVPAPAWVKYPHLQYRITRKRTFPAIQTLDKIWETLEEMNGGCMPL